MHIIILYNHDLGASGGNYVLMCGYQSLPASYPLYQSLDPQPFSILPEVSLIDVEH